MAQSDEVNEELIQVYCKMAELYIKEKRYDDALNCTNEAMKLKDFAKVRHYGASVNIITEI